MKAMVLAAGLGTRLRPLTNDRPKALVEIAGRTLLEITLTRLRSFGVTGVIVNVHHFADMVVEYLNAHNNFGLRIEISREDDLLLDTGGGLKKAVWFFTEDPGHRDEPFILHNVDVISTIDLREMLEFHRVNRALATLAVQDRQTSRYLLFDERGHLCGRRAGKEGAIEWAGASPDSSNPLSGRNSLNVTARAFSGIHVISPRLLDLLTEGGAFSIIASYLRLAGQGENILAFPADAYYWRDLGQLENLQRAAQDIKHGLGC